MHAVGAELTLVVERSSDLRADAAKLWRKRLRGTMALLASSERVPNDGESFLVLPLTDLGENLQGSNRMVALQAAREDSQKAGFEHLDASGSFDLR